MGSFYPKMFMSGTGLMTDLPKNKKGLNFLFPSKRAHPRVLAFGYHKGPLSVPGYGRIYPDRQGKHIKTDLI